MTAEQIGFLALVLATLWAAFRQGGMLERQVAVVLVIAALSSAFVQDANFQQIERGVLFIDVLILVYLAFVAIKTSKKWPAFACGFHICAVLTHINFVVNAFSAIAYADSTVFWSYLVMSSVLLGSILERD